MSRFLASCCLFALVTAAPMSAGAVDWSLAAGVGVSPDYEGSDDYRPVPLWRASAKDLYHPETFVQISGLSLSSNFIPHENFRLGISAEYAMERDDVHDNSVDNLDSTDDGFLLGLVGGYEFGVLENGKLGFELDSRFDLADDIGGLITAKVKFSSPVDDDKRWIVRASVESTYATDDYMDNYFGISASDLGTSDLSTFDADGGIKDVGFGGGVTYVITKQWSFTTLASYKRLVGDAEDSPVTDDAGDEDQLFAGALVNFRF